MNGETTVASRNPRQIHKQWNLDRMGYCTIIQNRRILSRYRMRVESVRQDLGKACLGFGVSGLQCRTVGFETGRRMVSGSPGSLSFWSSGVPNRITFTTQRDPCRRKAAADPSPSVAGGGDEAEDSRKQTQNAIESPKIKGITYPDVAFYINAVYWSTLLLAVLTGNEWLTQAAQFQNFVTVMLLSASFFALTALFRWIKDVQNREDAVQKRRDAKQTATHGFNVFIWLGFVLWYVAPPIASVIEWTGTVGAVMSLFGLILAFSAAMMVGSWSFLGTQTQIPSRILTTGPYALLRHPQGLGNILFLLGFSLAGGSLFSFAAFLVAFILYVKVLVPAEEAVLEGAFHLKYEKYKEKTPAFAWALLLLLVVEVVLMWRYAPYASPIDVTPPTKI